MAASRPPLRVLFSCVGAYGHFLPLVPLARALRDDGHEVAFATAASLADRVATAGFELHPAGLGQDEVEVRFAPVRAHLRTLPVDERRVVAYTERFGAIDAPAKVGDLAAVVAAWHPDLVVHESSDLAAPAVAASSGIQSVHHAFGRAIPRPCVERAAPEVAPLWTDLGVEPEPLCGLYRGTYVDLCPPSLQGEGVPDGVPVEAIRPTFPPERGETPPPWLDELPDRPVVYVTLGTVFNDLALFRLLLEALDGADCTVVLTVGPANDPAQLGPVPGNVVVERYVSQSFVLPRAAAVVAHGGSGSTLAALAEGLPLLFVPQGADQFENADRCVELGAGLRLMPNEVTADAVGAAVRALLDEPSFRTGARAVAAEIAAMPPPAEVARRLAASP